MMLCDFCERHGHANENYPLHDVARPQMLLHGIIEDELMFFELPLTGSYKHKMENSCNRRIIVEGGCSYCRSVGHSVEEIGPSGGLCLGDSAY
jgi:hypothetical protein